MSISKRIHSKIYRQTRHFGRDASHLLGLDEHFLRNARGSRILIYHGICLKDHTRYNPIFLKLKTFERHLEFYKRYFNVISLDDFYKGNFSADKFNIGITFDDGFVNNYRHVLPLLNKYQLPATFFITSIRDAGYDILWNDFLGLVSKHGPAKILYKNEEFYKDRYNKYISTQNDTSMADILRSCDFDAKEEMMRLLYPMVRCVKDRPDDEDYWLQMSKEQIRELSLSPFASVGSHGYYHNDLARININDAADELVRSKKYLENIIDGSVNSFAFPYGTYTPNVVDAAKNAGYKQLLCMDFHYAHDYSDPLMKERFTVNPFINTINQMHATISRSYE
jgi:peptidoglycan/xylan/chitin deacetylase (PgdA/CDA1 family)